VAPILEIDSCYQAMSHRCKMEATVDAEKCLPFHPKQQSDSEIIYLKGLVHLKMEIMSLMTTLRRKGSI